MSVSNGAGWGLLLSIVAAASCSKPCHPEIDSAGHYRVTLLEAYAAGGQFAFDEKFVFSDGRAKGPCNGDGLVPGVSFQLKAVGTDSDVTGTCFLTRAEMEDLPSALTSAQLTDNVGPTSVAQARNPLINSSAQVAYKDCEGFWAVSVRPAGNPDIFSVPSPGQPPPVVVYRLFIPTNDRCEICEDNFAGRLEKL